MARAQPVDEPEPSFLEEELDRAGDAQLMLITVAMWETLKLQGESEGLEPGHVLDKALRAYLEAHGSPRAVEYLHAVARRSKGG